jgi:hypothetical protein
VANRQLDHDLDGLQDNQDKTSSRPKLTSVVRPAAERRFDHWLIAIALPPLTEPIMRLLCHVNQARAALTRPRRPPRPGASSTATSSGWTPPTSRRKRRSR